MSYGIETNQRRLQNLTQLSFAKFDTIICLITSHMRRDVGGFVIEIFPLIVAEFGKYTCQVEIYIISFNISENQ